MLLEKIKQPAIPITRIAIPTLEGFQLLQASDIIRCEADGNYTHLFLKNKTKTTTTRNLKEMEEMLEDYSFIRVHNSYIVNINETERYIRGEGGYLVMSDGSSVNVSRSRKVLLKKFLPGME